MKFKLWLGISLIMAGMWVQARPVAAQEQFGIDREIVYTINEDLVAGVQENYSIENLTTQFFPEQFVLKVAETEIWNVYAQGDEGQELEWKKEVVEEDEKQMSSLTIRLPESEVGKGKQTRFQVWYDLKSAVANKGQIKELKLPKIVANPQQRHGIVKLRVKSSLGQPAYVVPEPESQTESGGWQEFVIPMTSLQDTGIRAVIGIFQIFDFQLKYYLENDQNSARDMEIALPPDTAYQRISLEMVEPAPRAVRVDADGNWLANYRVLARSSYQISATGRAMVFSQPWQTESRSSETLKRWTSPQPYWEADNPEIASISSRLNDAESIYGYVTEALKYDYNRLGNETARKGAVRALKEPDNSICMEFSDLFIALARSKGIPTRQAIGYAYSDNPALKPISLLTDVLHAWPEYWDENRQNWKPIDPTWGVTTGGQDYFNTWDMNHLVLAINGESSEQPSPAGFYKSENSQDKDVIVELGTKFPEDIPDWETKLDYDRSWNIFGQLTGTLTIENSGTTSVRDLRVNIKGSPTLQITRQELAVVDTLPPFGRATGKFVAKNHDWFPGGEILEVTVNGVTDRITVPWWVGMGQLMILLVIGGIGGIVTVKSFKTTRKLRSLFV